jgi:hypothetical protein
MVTGGFPSLFSLFSIFISSHCSNAVVCFLLPPQPATRNVVGMLSRDETPNGLPMGLLNGLPKPCFMVVISRSYPVQNCVLNGHAADDSTHLEVLSNVRIH